MKKLQVIKIGGNVIDNPVELEKFLTDFSKVSDLKILVHGGGKVATELARKLGIEQEMVNGRRITDAETLKVTTMVYAGLINKQVVAAMQSKGVNAIGLSGADADTIKASKRKVVDIDYGFVGDIESSGVNVEMISVFLENGITPVFSAITHNGEGQLLNTNADTIASALAVALSKKYEVQLNYCFEKNGVLRDVEDDNSVINVITKDSYKQLLSEGIIFKGMIPKLDNSFDAIKNGVSAVMIANSKDLIKITNNNGNTGTKLIAG
ncbi:Acetylglutamate kinase [sediment metagenome]|uniref:Acetylglutamate kinase n=1 Tax=sediment metagenome TaxID=749907 RepID=D9PEY5_9ZZZZ